MYDQDISFLIFASSITFLLISLGLVVFIILFFRSRRALLTKQQEAKLNFLKEINEVEVEIQDETLQRIGRELHDNIGQLLTVAKIHSNHIVSNNDLTYAKEMDEAIIQAIGEVKELSGILIHKNRSELRLIEALNNEAKRLNKIDGLNVQFNYTHEHIRFEKEKEVVFYRIIQEFINNSLKHSEATEIVVKFDQKESVTHIILSDNGIGFNVTEEKLGSGLTNMKMRAEMIGADFEMKSSAKYGTKVCMELQINTDTKAYEI